MWTKRKRRQMSYLQCGRNGNVDKWHTYTGDETETSTNVILTDVNETETSTNVKLAMWSKGKRWQMSYLRGERNGNVDKCHTYNVDETETSTNVIVTMWTKRKRRQISNLKCEQNGNVDKWHTYTGDETETSTNVILADVNETETSTNVKLKMWTKGKRRQMSYLKCGRNGNVDKWHTYTGDETETSTNAILKIWTKRKRWQMSY